MPTPLVGKHSLATVREGVEFYAAEDGGRCDCGKPSRLPHRCGHQPDGGASPASYKETFKVPALPAQKAKPKRRSVGAQMHSSPQRTLVQHDSPNPFYPNSPSPVYSPRIGLNLGAVSSPTATATEPDIDLDAGYNYQYFSSPSSSSSSSSGWSNDSLEWDDSDPFVVQPHASSSTIRASSETPTVLDDDSPRRPTKRSFRSPTMQPPPPPQVLYSPPRAVLQPRQPRFQNQHAQHLALHYQPQQHQPRPAVHAHPLAHPQPHVVHRPSVQLEAEPERITLLQIARTTPTQLLHLHLRKLDSSWTPGSLAVFTVLVFLLWALSNYWLQTASERAIVDFLRGLSPFVGFACFGVWVAAIAAF